MERVREIVQPGDMVLTLGAGNIYEVGEKLIRRFCESLQMFSKVEGAIDNSNTRAMIAMLMPSKHKIERNSNAKIEN